MVVMSLRTQQNKLDQSVRQVKEKVNAPRVTGQVMTMEQNLAKLTKAFEHFALQQSAAKPATQHHQAAVFASYSSSDPSRTTHTFMGTQRVGLPDRRPVHPDDIRNKLVRFLSRSHANT